MRKPETTVDLLDALQEKLGCDSDNQVAQRIRIPQGTLSNWRCGRAYPTEVHAITIAKALGMQPLHVLAIAAADRSPDEKTKREWLAQIALSISIGFFTIVGASTAYVPRSQDVGASDRSSVKSRRRRPADPLAA